MEARNNSVASALTQRDGDGQMGGGAIGDTIKIWVKDQLVMTHSDDEYKEGRFALQCHNAGMTFASQKSFIETGLSTKARIIKRECLFSHHDCNAVAHDNP